MVSLLKMDCPFLGASQHGAGSIRLLDRYLQSLVASTTAFGCLFPSTAVPVDASGFGLSGLPETGARSRCAIVGDSVLLFVLM